MTETEGRLQHRKECPLRATLIGSKKIACRNIDTYCTALTLCNRMRKYDKEVLGIEHKESNKFGHDVLYEAPQKDIDIDTINPSEL